MKNYFRFFLLTALAVSLLTQADAQVKKDKKANTKTKEVEEPLEPPPPPQEFKKMKIDVVPADTSAVPDQEHIDESMPGMPVPQVDFDTTAVPDDAFTRDIMKLLEVTNAINLGTMIAENMPKEYENNETMKKFYAKFISDMKNGTSRRWLERAYVREYRKNFTQEEIKELVRFYESPIGKKLTNVTLEILPGVMKQGKNIGAYRGIQLYMEIINEN
jgi:hypothetical protein